MEKGFYCQFMDFLPLCQSQPVYSFTPSELSLIISAFCALAGVALWIFKNQQNAKILETKAEISKDESEKRKIFYTEIENLKREIGNWKSKFTIIDLKHSSYEANFEKLENAMEKMSNKIENFENSVSLQISYQKDILKAILERLNK